MSELPPTLTVCLMRIAQLQMQPLDRNALQEAVASSSKLHTEPRPLLKQMAHLMHLPKPRWVRQPDPAAMPLLAHHAQMGWMVLRGLNAQQEWVVEVLNPDKGGFEEKALHDLQGLTMAKLSLAVPFESSNSPVYQMVKRELLSHKRVLAEAALAGLVLNLITLAVSFYSMQVYDRVVPTGASQTLMVLTLGVLVAAVFEVTIKHLRSHLYAHLIDNVDQRLSRAVYMRFLSLRLDQLPRSVGTLPTAPKPSNRPTAPSAATEPDTAVVTAFAAMAGLICAVTSVMTKGVSCAEISALAHKSLSRQWWLLSKPPGKGTVACVCQVSSAMSFSWAAEVCGVASTASSTSSVFERICPVSSEVLAKNPGNSWTSSPLTQICSACPLRRIC